MKTRFLIPITVLCGIAVALFAQTVPTPPAPPAAVQLNYVPLTVTNANNFAVNAPGANRQALTTDGVGHFIWADVGSASGSGVVTIAQGATPSGAPAAGIILCVNLGPNPGMWTWDSTSSAWQPLIAPGP